MPDSISQSTATVLRINGREMSYCAIFVRDLREAIPPSSFPSSSSFCASSSSSSTPPFSRPSSAKRVSFIPSLAEADIAVTRPANARSCERVLPAYPFVLGRFVFFLSLAHTHSLSSSLFLSRAVTEIASGLHFFAGR